MGQASAGAIGRPVMAGLVTAVVGFAASFAVVLAGLRNVGASPQQAASGLLAVTIARGLASLALASTTRIPVTIAWSTPGAALLASIAGLQGGWPVAVGAFMVTGLLLAAIGLIRPLGRLARSIPLPLANAMLAGVLLPLCLAPVRGLEQAPTVVGVLILVWILLIVLTPRWAAPGALAAALALAATSDEVRGLGPSAWIPAVTWTTPSLELAAVVSVALPLLVVTMASQNIPGIAVLASFGYVAPFRRAMVVTGLGTAAVAPLGAHAINLAAISAALAAGPEAGPDRSRRWIAATTAGGAWVLIGIGSAGVVALALAAPGGLIEAAAGLALIPTMAAALRSAFGGGVPGRADLPAAVTFLVAVSGLHPWGIGSAFWGLVIGLGLAFALRSRPDGKRAPSNEHVRPKLENQER
ncbi:MAG: benzoate/H(+) symporter BenE family transporter [Actinomycetales bacterium]